MAAVQRPEKIATMINGVERYNTENVTVLEEYLIKQCESNEYDLEANLALLKLYQFNPSLAKEPVIIKILVKALTAIPAPDFNLCLYLLAEQAHLESIEKLTELQQLLEQARYAKFWQSDLKPWVAVVPNFESEIRLVIARVMAMSYQTITASALAANLGLTGDAFDQFCSSQQWQKSGELVQIPINKGNEAKAVVIRENIKFEQLTKVIGYSNEM
ncbi:Eukaryotic translation initiation factor 3 subunit K [Choanephora cucurbitarum]|uniref:Eukaryotic translation initiation factor 3 subunit K n=1 Tax=Choanephora cucurbitarum TaxID=101091 RepID=A0A1C7NK89_9FUNG|nr:Eukaryotic translation initiation factor 3 subunit K [Choanephora cucurbitarum]